MSELKGLSTVFIFFYLWYTHTHKLFTCWKKKTNFPKYLNCTYEVPQTVDNSDILDTCTTAVTIFLYYFLNKYVASSLLFLCELTENILSQKKHTQKINNLTFTLSLVPKIYLWSKNNHHSMLTMNALCASATEKMHWDGNETVICIQNFLYCWFSGTTSTKVLAV